MLDLENLPCAIRRSIQTDNKIKTISPTSVTNIFTKACSYEAVECSTSGAGSPGRAGAALGSAVVLSGAAAGASCGAGLDAEGAAACKEKNGKAKNRI